MRYIILLLIAGMLFTACTSSKKLLEKGKYDQAIEKSVKDRSKALIYGNRNIFRY